MNKNNEGNYILIIISIGLIITVGDKKITNIIIPVLFLLVIIKQLKYIRELILPTKKSYMQIFAFFLGVIVLMCIIYFYANTFTHYIVGLLGIFMFITLCIKEGISSKGFISMYKYKELILWDEIEKIVIVICSNNIKIKVCGGFMQQTFYFKKDDYYKIIDIIKENLNTKTKLETIFNE